MNLYRATSLFMTIIFAVVGLIFLFFPSGVLTLFNSISPPFGLRPSPTESMNFYLILAVGYMYMVTVLAFMMYRYPHNRLFPLLLSHGKLASSVLSFGFFLRYQPYLIYLANFAVDGFIGILAFLFYLKLKRVPE